MLFLGEEFRSMLGSQNDMFQKYFTRNLVFFEHGKLEEQSTDTRKLRKFSNLSFINFPAFSENRKFFQNLERERFVCYLRQKTDFFDNRKATLSKEASNFVEKTLFSIKNDCVNEYLKNVKKNMAVSEIRTCYLWAI